MSFKYLLGRVLHMDYQAMLKKINSIHKKTNKSRIAIFNDMRHCATKYGAGYMDYDLFEMYNLTEDERDTYLTRGRNNDLIKKYNNQEYTHIFANKVEFNTKFKDFIKRDWIEIKEDNQKEVIAFMKKHKSFMLKPINGTCGKGIQKLNIKDIKDVNAFLDNLKLEETKYELEEVLIQDKSVSAIYPDAINTVRIVTILNNDEVYVICAYFRIGNGKYVDNFNSGGMVAPINEETGEVIDAAIDKNKNLYDAHPLTNHPIKGFVFSDWQKAIDLVKKASLLEKHVCYVGWDVCFSANGPLLVEGNDYPGHDIYQLPEHTPNHIGIMPKFNKVNNSSNKVKKQV